MPIGSAPTTSRRSSRRAAEEGDVIEDVLVFALTDTGFSVVGGRGRGAGWAGIVEIGSDDPIVGKAWRSGTTVRASARRSTHVTGPYHARHAVAVPVGDRHVVLFGAEREITARDADLVRQAATAVDGAHGVPADKLLADELELVHAVRALMAYRPENVSDTLRHVAEIAADALACELAFIRVEHDGTVVSATIGVDGASAGPAPAERHLDTVASTGRSIVEQACPPGEDILGVTVASYLSLPIGEGPAIGAISLAHAPEHARGFTSLCQRIGRAVAEAAELLITQAVAREQLAAERDLLARVSGTDALTGIGNRRAWNEEAARLHSFETPIVASVLSFDLDGLKATNDAYGHAAGDTLIRAAAHLLVSCVRDEDLVARMGGDEFAVLLRGADVEAARRIRARVRRAERVWRVTEHGLTPRLSIGLARVEGNDLEAARDAADTGMYADKRRRAARAARVRRSRRTASAHRGRRNTDR